MNYWLVRADWNNGGTQFERFIKEKIWENGYSNKFQKSVNSIKIGDTLFLADKSEIKYSAICSKNYNNGQKVAVEEWLAFNKPIHFPGKGAYAQTITRFASEKLLLKILTELSSRKLIKASTEQLIEPTKVAYLDGIHIKQYLSIEEIKIENLKDKKEIYFVGGNGDGKTILLQAILLALKKSYSGRVIEYLKNTYKNDEIKNRMELYVKDEFSEKYSKNKNIENIFAYGINRNKIDYQNSDKSGYNGLFDTSDKQETTYLKDPFYELGDNYNGDNPFMKEFIDKLNNIILKKDYKIFNGGDIDFRELSEGYKSTIIWLYDLVSRLIENRKDDDLVYKLKDFKAIVLIDEVDLYLHPTWKYDFVYNLRKVFPNIQFIMITHSTATILGASKDAIFYKVYKDGIETKISQPMNNIKNLMANNLSTSPLFDMDTARARNSDNKLETDEDYIYTKIHQIVSEQMKGKKAIIEDEVVTIIKKELDDYIKEQGL